MKKNKIILLLLSYHCMAKPFPLSAVDVKNLACIYADQVMVGGMHAAGHLLTARLAVLMGASANNKFAIYSIALTPYLKIPFAVNLTTPTFRSKKINTLVAIAGPIGGLIGTYLRLKINNISTEYSSEKTIYQNIKVGLAKPFYKGHSNLIAYTMGFSTLVECSSLIPGRHCNPEK